jgi:hypothetical protein
VVLWSWDRPLSYTALFDLRVLGFQYFELLPTLATATNLHCNMSDATDGDEQSAVSSLVGSIVGNSKQRFGAARFETLKATLACAAQANTILTGGVIGTDIVESPLIDSMLDAYISASRGRTIVVCAPADSGKTHAAEFLMHGKHPFRPDRSLKINAASMQDFPVDFSRDELGVEKQAGPEGPGELWIR